jgi:hypothetical protein
MIDSIDNYTLLVQGKIFPETYEYISLYKKLGFRICLSSYQSIELDIDQIVINDISQAEKLSSEKTGTTPSGKFQIYSTFNGLQTIGTKYVIKIRTDEFYNLNKILKMFLNDDDKIVFHNLYYRPPKPQWGYFHISDKLLVAKTKNLLAMFSVAYDIVSCKTNIIYHPHCVEDLLGYSFLLKKTNFSERICFKYRNILMNNYYNFINFTELIPFDMKFNSISNNIYTETTIDPDSKSLWINDIIRSADVLWRINHNENNIT